jgi:selenocysteine lyase/cysteine desulfurase
LKLCYWAFAAKGDEQFKERLRITPSPVHSDADIDKLLNALGEIWSQCELARRDMAA